jgi:hypothetical protein
MADELSGWTRSRPARIAFLIEEDDHSASALDGIFADCYGRWGGRFSLIVPCEDRKISSGYWPWLERFGPDIVYSYVPLGDDDVLEVHERLAPSAYTLHKITQEPRLDVYGFKPSYDVVLLSSLSLVFKLARFAPAARDGAPVKIIDCWFTENPSRLLTDNFGTYTYSVGGSIFPADASVAASVISVVSPDNQRDRRLGVPRDLRTLPDETAAYEQYAERRATALSVMSAQFSPRLQFHDSHWHRSFNLVLGETFNDRILFWNARLLAPAWLDNDLGALRVTMEALKDKRFLDVVANLLRHRNHFGTGGQANVTIRSTSASAEMLEEAAELLRSTKPWGGISIELLSGLESIVPNKENLSYATEHSHADAPFYRMPEWTHFNWTAPIARPPTKLPEHLADAPSQQTFAQGFWCVDFSLEFDTEDIRYGDNVWTLPARWRIARAFEHKHVGTDGPTGWSPPGWRGQSGYYSTYVSEIRPIATVEPPTPFDAIQWALAIDGTRPPRLSGTYPPNKVGRLAPSNEARYLTGILGMIGGLGGASGLLLHPFLVDLFASFGGTTNLPPEKVIPTANRLKKRARFEPRFDLRDEAEREVLAALIVKASGTLRKPMDYISYDDLSKRWELYRKAYWLANPQPDVPDDPVEWDAHEQRSLDACLIELRQRQMLFQGHQWTCRHCHHKNWLDLSELAAELSCRICKKAEAAPINIRWLFRPNQFVIESLRDHSALSLVWTLVTLQARCRGSFFFVEPTWFYFDQDGDRPDAEADLLVILDGKAAVCEVKASWAIRCCASGRDGHRTKVRD